MGDLWDEIPKATGGGGSQRPGMEASAEEASLSGCKWRRQRGADAGRLSGSNLRVRPPVGLCLVLKRV